MQTIRKGIHLKVFSGTKYKTIIGSAKETTSSIVKTYDY